MSRENLQEALCLYTTDTLTSINTVRRFCEGISSWKSAWDKELKTMKDITESKSRNGVAENKLDDVLKVTQGLKVLDSFLDAVEKLAVNSLHVFMEENQVIRLPTGISLKQVQDVIKAARLICPLLVLFKRDAEVFFIPKLQNVEVLRYQLEEYIKNTETICETMEKSFSSDLQLQMNTECEVNLSVDLSEDEIQKMLQHISELQEIRMDPHFRMVFLFQEVSCSGFIEEFDKRQPRMQKFLKELEEVAVQLDSMNKGSKISSVVGSSVGVVGGVMYLVGLALLPFTAGLSTGLIVGGAAAAGTSAANSAVTTAVEWGVNSAHKTKADDVFQKFTEDVQSLQGYLEKVSGQPPCTVEASNGAMNGVRAKGSLALSQFLRARAALWSSEMDSWKKIHDSLCEGLLTSEKKKAVLEKPFYPGSSRNGEGRN